jgi:hypothetical protein
MPQPSALLELLQPVLMHQEPQYQVNDVDDLNALDA